MLLFCLYRRYQYLQKLIMVWRESVQNLIDSVSVEDCIYKWSHNTIRLIKMYVPLFSFRTRNITDANAWHKHHVPNVLLEEQEQAVESTRGKREGPQPCRVAVNILHAFTREQGLQR